MSATTKKQLQGVALERSALHVIVPVSNPVRYASRYRLAQEFLTRLDEQGVTYTLVELQLGDREFVLDAEGRNWLGYRSFSEMWHKENLINLGIDLARSDARYVAWIDADVAFLRPDWVEETLHQLQHHEFVQMFSHAIDLGSNGEPLHIHQGFVYSYLNGARPGARYEHWHPGFAWAARVETLTEMGGLIDRAILGSADRHMAAALVGKAETTIVPGVHPNYRAMVMDWQRRADVYVQRDIGFVAGTIAHYWHGPKAKRGYNSRWQILVDDQYDPFLDVRTDSCCEPLYLSSRNPKLRDDLRAYFRSRDEDAR